MQDEQLQNGAIAADPNETIQEGQDLSVQDGPGDAEQAAELVTEEDTKEEVAEEAASAE